MGKKEQKTILLVEDEVLIAMAEKTDLENFGYNVITAHTGENAIKKARDNNAIDIILMDIDLGKGIDGTEVAKIILKERDIPVLFMSSHQETEIVDKTEAITSYGYVVKHSGITILDASIKMAFKLFKTNKYLMESEERFRKIVEQAPLAMAIVSMKGVIEFINNKAIKVFGYLPEDIPNMDRWWLQAYPNEGYRKDVVNEWMGRVQKAIIEGTEIIGSEFQVTCKDGSIKTIIISGAIVSDKVFVLFDNITERKQAEERVRKLTRVYSLLSHINQIIVRNHNQQELFQSVCNLAIDTGKFKMAWIGEINSETNKVDVIASQGITTDYLEKINIDLNDKVRSGGMTGRATITNTHAISNDILNDESMKPWHESAKKNGYLSSAAFPLIVHGKIWGAFNIYSDETSFFDEEEVKLFDELTNDISFSIEVKLNESKRLQAENDLKKSLHDWQAIFNGIPQPTTLMDLEQNIIMGNNTFEQKFGLKLTNYQNKKCWKFFHGPNTTCPTEGCPFSKMQKTYKTETSDIVVEMLNGYYIVSCTPIFDDSGKVEKVIHIATDITERKQAEEKIISLLAEKELLLKEVHHRIKNNMSTIKSLLSLQAGKSKDPAVVTALKDAESRVQSIMVLYEKLYKSIHFNDISVKEYLPILVDQIVSNFPNSDSIKIEKNIEEFVLSPERIFVVGIIINELLTNIMKYAFTDRTDGLITISASLKGNKVSLIIQDNGNGISKSIDLENSPGFGLMIVKLLIEQIEGTIRIEYDNGTRVILEFEK